MATVITVKYVENARQERAEPMLSNATPIEKEMLVNINCSIRIIIDYVRKIAQLDEKSKNRAPENRLPFQINFTVEFDLCDEITYQLKNVYAFQSYVSGLMVLQPGLTYLIVILQRDSSGQILNAVPVVAERSNKNFSDTVAKIRKQTRKQSGISVNSKFL